jgi:hypothetical protein
MSELRFWNDLDATLTAADYQEPLPWIERLPPGELLVWLRHVIWTGETQPVLTPNSAAVATHLVSLFKHGSTELMTRLRAILPILVQEWGRDDPSGSLDNLLVLTGMLRCATAETSIGLLTTERLAGVEGEVPLRQRCLSVLSGIGSQPQTIEVFKSYLFDIDYTALCYRALFRLDRAYAARQFHLVIDIYGEGGKENHLELMLRALLFRQLPQEQHVDALGQVLEETPIAKLGKVLSVLRTVGIILLRHEEELLLQYLSQEETTDQPPTLNTTSWESERIDTIAQEIDAIFLFDPGVKEIYQSFMTSGPLSKGM